MAPASEQPAFVSRQRVYHGLCIITLSSVIAGTHSRDSPHKQAVTNKLLVFFFVLLSVSRLDPEVADNRPRAIAEPTQIPVRYLLLLNTSGCSLQCPTECDPLCSPQRSNEMESVIIVHRIRPAREILTASGDQDPFLIGVPGSRQLDMPQCPSPAPIRGILRVELCLLPYEIGRERNENLFR